jgi:hypothetical protein
MFFIQDLVDRQGRSSYTSYQVAFFKREFLTGNKEENGRRKDYPFNRDCAERWLSLQDRSGGLIRNYARFTADS